MILTENSRPKVGIPITDTNDGGVLWEFPNGVTGIIDRDTCNYLCKVRLGLIKPDSRKVEFSTL